MAKTTTSALSGDMLKKLSDKATELRDVELEIATLEERLSTLNTRKYNIEREELPELMGEAGVDSVGIPASGNQPALDLKLRPFYKAGIGAEWEPERRQAGFDYLDEVGAGDLIKTGLIVAFAREDREEAKTLLKQLRKLGHKPEIKQDVHWATLTSWLKEKSEAGDDVKLDLIGGQVGMIVKPTPRKK